MYFIFVFTFFIFVFTFVLIFLSCRYMFCLVVIFSLYKCLVFKGMRTGADWVATHLRSTKAQSRRSELVHNISRSLTHKTRTPRNIKQDNETRQLNTGLGARTRIVGLQLGAEHGRDHRRGHTFKHLCCLNIPLSASVLFQLFRRTHN